MSAWEGGGLKAADAGRPPPPGRGNFFGGAAFVKLIFRRKIKFEKFAIIMHNKYYISSDEFMGSCRQCRGIFPGKGGGRGGLRKTHTGRGGGAHRAARAQKKRPPPTREAAGQGKPAMNSQIQCCKGGSMPHGGGGSQAFSAPPAAKGIGQSGPPPDGSLQESAGQYRSPRLERPGKWT